MKGFVMRIIGRDGKFQGIWLAVLAVAFMLHAVALAEGERPVYLTWQGDTSTTMTVTFQNNTDAGEALVYWDTVARDGEIGAYKNSTVCVSNKVPGVAGLERPAVLGWSAEFAKTVTYLQDRTVYTAELKGLEPGKNYYFVAGNDEMGYSEEHFFRTVSREKKPMRFAQGGDMGISPAMMTLVKHTATYDPEFVLVGGDIAYANGELLRAGAWDIWIRTWYNHMRGADGRLIPMVLAIGNHEVNKVHKEPVPKAPFFFGYLPQGGLPYFTRTFGPDIVLYTLDSDHVIPHLAQVDWLRGELEKHKEVKWQLAMYHVPLYPSHRPFSGGSNIMGRLHWMPLFDEYGIDLAMENHDHTHKRTHRLKGNEIDPEGTLYIGDGCYGVGPREGDSKEEWYLASFNSIQHFWVVDVDGDTMHLRTIDIDNKVIDEYTLKK